MCYNGFMNNSASDSESFVGQVYGTAEDMLLYLKEHECGCEFCAERIAWLEESIASGVKLEPPYVQPRS